MLSRNDLITNTFYLDSCEADYYCTHDTALQTWCCPDSMDLTECAAAYSVTGGLETPEPTTSTVAETTSTSTSSVPETTTTSSSSSPSSTPSSTSTPWTTPSSSYTPSSTWYSANSTTSTPIVTTITTTTEVTSPGEETTTAQEPSATGAATVSGVSLSLLIAAAGFLALI